MADALQILLERLGERPIDISEVKDDDPAVRSIYRTTWRDLQDEGLIKPHYTIGSCGYFLTGPGWLRAMKDAGRLDTPEFHIAFGQLNATLRRFADIRGEDDFQQFHVVAAEAKVAEPWLYNVLKSEIWQRKYSKFGAKVIEEQMENMVFIPSRFNMPLTSEF
jgi:hypothetical protein